MDASVGVKIIGVAGGRGAGKTTFCAAIAASFPDKVTIICAEWFLKGTDRNRPGDYDVSAIVSTLRQIKAAKIGEMINVATSHRIHVHNIVLIEGLFVLHEPDIRGAVDVKIFIECDGDRRLTRCLQADYSRWADIDSEYFGEAAPAFDAYILPSKRYTDVEIPNNNDDKFKRASLDLINSFIAGQN